MRYFWLIGLSLLIVGAVSIEMVLVPILGPFLQPTGRYALGVTRYEVEDPLRSDSYRPTTRRFMIDLYFPSSAPTGKKFEYQPRTLKALKAMLGRDTWVPQIVWDHFLTGIMSYAQPQAPIAQGPFPVIIFLPGIGADALYNVYLEELASHGFVVASIEPPYDIVVSVMSDGSVKELDSSLKEAMRKVDRDAIYAYRKRAHEEWLKDTDVVITFLEQLTANPVSPWYKKLDLARLGLLGHSHGGGVVTAFCAANKRCRAGVNMDGWTKTANSIEPFSTPFLFLANEKGMNELQQLANAMPESAEYKEISHAGHAAFSDHILLKQPLRWFLGVNRGDSFHVRQEIQRALINFFNRTIKEP